MPPLRRVHDGHHPRRLNGGRGGVQLATGNAGPTEPAASYSEFQFFYCGTRVSAARDGRFKIHFTTTAYEDDAAQICRDSVICSCHGKTHDPPLVFDMWADPGESTPLDIGTDEAAAAALNTIAARVAEHERTVEPVPSQTELFPRTPSSLPCCGAEEHGSWHHWYLVLTDGCGC